MSRAEARSISAFGQAASRIEECAVPLTLIDGPVGEGVAARNRREAQIVRLYCADCMLRATCLQIGLNGQEKEGVWGGTTSLQRGKFFKGKLPLEALLPKQSVGTMTAPELVATPVVKAEANDVVVDMQAYRDSKA